jgi:hypothetical protein
MEAPSMGGARDNASAVESLGWLKLRDSSEDTQEN